MKTDKITRILILYSLLINGHKVNKFFFSMEHGINERSFDRDIEDIRLFLSEIYSTNELVFDKLENAYYLTGPLQKEIDYTEAFVLAKALIGSGALRKDEVEGVVGALIENVNNKESKKLKSQLINDIETYTEGAHNKAILKFVRDLSNCIFKENYIRMKYRISNKSVKIIDVYPKDIICEKSRFVLIATEKSNNNDTKKYSIDMIEEFEIIR